MRGSGEVDVASARGDPASRLREGLERHRAGDLAGARAAYDEVLALQPDQPDALHLRGLVAHALGNVDRALDDVRRAAALAPSPRHHANLGMVLVSAGQNEAAAEACRRALAVRPDYPEAWNTLGVALARLDRAEEALVAYDCALARQPAYAEAHLNRGDALSMLWRYAEAEAAYREAFAQCPSWNVPAARPRVVYVATDLTQPGHVYRCLRMADAARAAGWETDMLALDAATPEQLRGARVVVLWRVELSAKVCRLIAFARASGSRIALDVDDLIIEPDLASLDVVDGIRTVGSTEARVRAHFRRMRQTLDAVDFATCTTAELARWLRRVSKPCWELPNGFAVATWRASRAAVRARAGATGDGLLRIGYAAGTRTHQRDIARAVPALAAALRARPQARLVLFRSRDDRGGVVDLAELPALGDCAGQIEWRDLVPLEALPAELARFDVNIVPLEAGNPFVEAKSELKYFEAALVSIPTIASPTGPFRRAIEDGVTGLLAEDDRAWTACLDRLLDDPAARAGMGRAAYHDALWRFGPWRAARRMRAVLSQWEGGADGVRAFAADLAMSEQSAPRPLVPASTTLFQRDAGGESAVTVTVASFNYAAYLVEALESVAAQTLRPLDLVVVDDGSRDASVALALDWARAHAARFNRIAVLATRANAGLGGNRNVGFDWAETPWVLPVDADNRLRPACAERLLSACVAGDAAFAYPGLRHFGAATRDVPAIPFEPQRLRAGNYIDAMALVAAWAWAACGGYYVERDAMGWEDYDLWCAMAERGLHGVAVDEMLAEYRVHAAAMSDVLVEVEGRKQRLVALLERRHPWLHVVARGAAPRGAGP